ncbi:MAG: hypothetical protein WC584_02865 [Candidatus Pacearchaeota archaeon]
MHSIESLREIRSMQSMFGNCSLDVGERYERRPPRKSSKSYTDPKKGEVVAILTYNLATRKITISKPDSQ